MSTTTPPIPLRTNGQPIDQSWFNGLKQVAENHEGRLGFLDQELQQFVFRSEAPVNHWTLPAMVCVIPIIENINLSDAKVYVFTPGDFGTFQVDFQFKRGTAAWQSLLSTKPSVDVSVAAPSVSTNGVINPVYKNLVPGDFLACVITNYQVTQRSFSANLFFTKAT